MELKPTAPSHRFGVSLSVALFFAAAGLYLLSFGPVLRYSGKPMTITGSTGGRIAGPVKALPGWVGVLYRPVFAVMGPQLTPAYGRHDPLNTYKRYVKWWYDRP